MGRPRTSAVLKLLNGSTATNPGRQRDDAKATPAGKLERPPPDAGLSPAERRAFDWFVSVAAMPAIHRPIDGAMLSALARCYVALETAHQATLRDGLITTDDEGRQHIPPSVGLERRLVVELRSLMLDLGMSPQGRLKIAPPMDGSGAPSAWDDVAGGG